VVFHGKFMQALNDVLNGRFFADSSCEMTMSTENETSEEKEAREKWTHLTPFFTPY